ncbi:MAG: alkaline phosphatase D family protein [Magnetococcales bacterium]|nr:alkaline phosphatase D family protein [Magnetococcales bacterium]
MNPCPRVLARREFLRATGAWVALLALPQLGQTEAVVLKPVSSPFGLGIASGSPMADGFVLWTRLVGSEIPASQAVRVAWEVFDLANPERIVVQGQAVAVPELAHSVHVEVAGLTADRWYGYRFRVGEAVSATGRTRTLPVATALPSRLRLAFASCQSWEHGLYAAYHHMQGENLDLVLFLGDYIYEWASSSNPGHVRHHHLPAIQNLADFRIRYALYKSDPMLQAMHAHCPWLVIWDDHEVENDYAGIRSVYDTKDFAQRRAAAYQAYYEHMPLRASTLLEGLEGMARGAEMRIYDRVEFGRLATIHMLDCRQYRDAPLCPPKQTTPGIFAVCTEPDERRSMLGSTQEKWLDEGFRLSAQQKTLWNIVAQQGRFTPGNYPHGKGVNLSIDTWDGFPDARQRLLQSLVRHKPRNPLILGGDIHHNLVARVHQDPYDVQSPVVAGEFVGTSITSRGWQSREDAQRRAAENPHCLYTNPEKRGYGVVEVTPVQARVALRGLDDAQNAHSGIATLASFVVEDGKPLQPVRE